MFGSYSAGRAFMLVQAFTVFLALIGTTLSCLSTGARVTYAMGKDEEVPGHFGMLHGKTLTPHRVDLDAGRPLGGHRHRHRRASTSAAPRPRRSTRSTSGFWYSIGVFKDPATYAKLPNTLVIVTLVSNFGTFLLYMLTCLTAIVAFREHHSSTASSTCSCRCSAWWPTCSACCSTWSGRSWCPA